MGTCPHPPSPKGRGEIQGFYELYMPGNFAILRLHIGP